MIEKAMDEIQFEKDYIEHQLIAKHTKKTKIIALISIIFIIILAFFSYTINSDNTKDKVTANLSKISKNRIITKAVENNTDNYKNNKNIENIFIVLNIIVIILLIIILAVRKTIYYSPRMIKDYENLESVLIKWQKIDIFLIITAFILPISGFVANIIGMEFNRTIHFFIASALLIIMLMPMGIKVRSKLKLLKEHFIDI